MNFNFSDFLARSSDKNISDTTLFKVLNGLPPVSKDGPWIAGGSVRRTIQGKEPDSDFDFFFKNEDQLKLFIEALELKGFVKIKETKHHVHHRGTIEGSKIPIDVQSIRFKYYSSAEEVIDSFDYTICQFVYDGNRVTIGDYSLWDLGRNRLAIHKLTYPVASMRRMLKYASQGFTACNGCLTTLLRETASRQELLAELGVHYVD